jgi:hypothetical protein
MTATAPTAIKAHGCEPNTSTLTGGRERIIEAAYAPFTRHGTRTVGVDTIVAAARVAKMTLHRPWRNNRTGNPGSVTCHVERRVSLAGEQNIPAPDATRLTRRARMTRRPRMLILLPVATTTLTSCGR